MKKELSDAYEHIVFKPGTSIQIIMIFREAMTNALKHAQCKYVYFDYAIHDNEFEFSLEDDWIGISENTAGLIQNGL